MKYVQNNKKYALSLNAKLNGAEKSFRFDCRRLYQDTGNVATSGETPIEDTDVEYLLENCEPFKKLVEQGYITISDAPVAESDATVVALEEENARLKAELEEAKKEGGSGNSAKVTKLEKEVTSLKKQLEAAVKKGKGVKEKVPEEETPIDEDAEK